MSYYGTTRGIGIPFLDEAFGAVGLDPVQGGIEETINNIQTVITDPSIESIADVFPNNFGIPGMESVPIGLAPINNAIDVADTFVDLPGVVGTDGDAKDPISYSGGGIAAGLGLDNKPQQSTQTPKPMNGMSCPIGYMANPDYNPVAESRFRSAKLTSPATRGQPMPGNPQCIPNPSNPNPDLNHQPNVNPGVGKDPCLPEWSDVPYFDKKKTACKDESKKLGQMEDWINGKAEQLCKIKEDYQERIRRFNMEGCGNYDLSDPEPPKEPDKEKPKEECCGGCGCGCGGDHAHSSDEQKNVDMEETKACGCGDEPKKAKVKYMPKKGKKTCTRSTYKAVAKLPASTKKQPPKKKKVSCGTTPAVAFKFSLKGKRAAAKTIRKNGPAKKKRKC